MKAVRFRAATPVRRSTTPAESNPIFEVKGKGLDVCPRGQQNTQVGVSGKHNKHAKEHQRDGTRNTRGQQRRPQSDNLPRRIQELLLLSGMDSYLPEHANDKVSSYLRNLSDTQHGHHELLEAHADYYNPQTLSVGTENYSRQQSEVNDQRRSYAEDDNYLMEKAGVCNQLHGSSTNSANVQNYQNRYISEQQTCKTETVGEQVHRGQSGHFMNYMFHMDPSGADKCLTQQSAVNSYHTNAASVQHQAAHSTAQQTWQSSLSNVHHNQANHSGLYPDSQKVHLSTQSHQAVSSGHHSQTNQHSSQAMEQSQGVQYLSNHSGLHPDSQKVHLSTQSHQAVSSGHHSQTNQHSSQAMEQSQGVQYLSNHSGLHPDSQKVYLSTQSHQAVSNGHHSQTNQHSSQAMEQSQGVQYLSNHSGLHPDSQKVHLSTQSHQAVSNGHHSQTNQHSSQAMEQSQGVQYLSNHSGLHPDSQKVYLSTQSHQAVSNGHHSQTNQHSSQAMEQSQGVQYLSNHSGLYPDSQKIHISNKSYQKADGVHHSQTSQHSLQTVEQSKGMQYQTGAGQVHQFQTKNAAAQQNHQREQSERQNHQTMASNSFQCQTDHPGIHQNVNSGIQQFQVNKQDFEHSQKSASTVQHSQTNQHNFQTVGQSTGLQYQAGTGHHSQMGLQYKAGTGRHSQTNQNSFQTVGQSTGLQYQAGTGHHSQTNQNSFQTVGQSTGLQYKTVTGHHSQTNQNSFQTVGQSTGLQYQAGTGHHSQTNQNSFQTVGQSTGLQYKASTGHIQQQFQTDNVAIQQNHQREQMGASNIFQHQVGHQGVHQNVSSGVQHLQVNRQGMETLQKDYSQADSYQREQSGVRFLGDAAVNQYGQSQPFSYQQNNIQVEHRISEEVQKSQSYGSQLYNIAQSCAGTQHGQSGSVNYQQSSVQVQQEKTEEAQVQKSQTYGSVQNITQNRTGKHGQNNVTDIWSFEVLKHAKEKNNWIQAPEDQLNQKDAKTYKTGVAGRVKDSKRETEVQHYQRESSTVQQYQKETSTAQQSFGPRSEMKQYQVNHLSQNQTQHEVENAKYQRDVTAMKDYQIEVHNKQPDCWASKVNLSQQPTEVALSNYMQYVAKTQQCKREQLEAQQRQAVRTESVVRNPGDAHFRIQAANQSRPDDSQLSGKKAHFSDNAEIQIFQNEGERSGQCFNMSNETQNYSKDDQSKSYSYNSDGIQFLLRQRQQTEHLHRTQTEFVEELEQSRESAMGINLHQSMDFEDPDSEDEWLDEEYLNVEEDHGEALESQIFSTYELETRQRQLHEAEFQVIESQMNRVGNKSRQIKIKCSQTRKDYQREKSQVQQTQKRRCQSASSAAYHRSSNARGAGGAKDTQSARVRCSSARASTRSNQVTQSRERTKTHTSELHFSLTVDGLLPGEGGEYVPRATLSTIEVEALMREKVRSKYDSLKQAFQTYDVDQNETVTKGEFRRVLESYCFPMTTEQFDCINNKVDKTHTGSIKYVDFLQKFYGAGGSPARLRPVRSGPGAPREVNMDVIEKLLRDKISQNLKTVVRGLQLFDYNMDGKIQRHELRRVLENYCFKFTDVQFDKLWLRYDFHHTGLVNYRDFLQRLGVKAKLLGKPPSNDVVGALKWPAVVSQQQQQTGANQFASTRVREQQKQDEALLQVLNFDQIEIEFRSRMKENYQRLKRAFMAIDKHLDGFVSIEDLRAILSNFTLPMSDQLFAQLMTRCGVRGTNRVAWELFLDKFQSPVSLGNGQTLPIQPNHKFHPVMETQQSVDWEAIWKQLYRHVQTGYPSIKQAFLQFDKNRDGKVTKKEFRQVVERFTFRLEDAQFKELISRLNLAQGTRVSYHDFLELFEEKESLKEGHKWLRSVHKFNDKPKPAIMAWETVEDLLREKITQYWKNVADNLMLYDADAKGYITPKQMKRVIDRQVMPISDDHFASLLDRCEDRREGKVNYVEFLTKLKVDVRPGDLVGLSSQIMDSSGRAEIRRQNDQYIRQQIIDDNAVNRTNMMSAEEVIIRIKDKLSQFTPEIRKAFLACDKKGKGRITKRQFREMLASLGMLMTDEQYEELMSGLHLHNGHMEYVDFVMNFGDPRPPDANSIIRSGNHHVNAIRGDQFGMTVDEVETKLRAKLRENFANLRGAFYKFDDNHNGCLTKKNFRRMLDSFMIFMSDEEYEKLCERHGITRSTRISYREFLDRFEVRDTAEGHKWLNSVHRYNETFPPKPLSAEEAHQTLREKAYRQWSDLAKAFRQIDGKGNGIISKRELRDLLYKFVMPLTDEEFKKLWARYDKEGKGYISHTNFLEHLGAPEHAPGDYTGPSQRIIDGSRFNIDLHNALQQQRHEDITQKQANLTSHMSATEVIRQLKDKIRDSYADLYKAFCKYDTQNRGSLSVSDIQKVLVEQNFYITDEEFFLLLDMIGMHTDKSRLNYAQFLAAFEDGRKSSYGRRPGEVRIEEYSNLTPEEADQKLQTKLEKNIDDVTRTLTAMDKEQTGRIKVDELRRVIDLYCFRLTHDQWRRVKAGLSIGPDNCVDYATFLKNYVGAEHTRYDKAVQALQNAAPLPVYQLVTVDEVQERIQECVRSHHQNILRDLSEADYAGIGSVSQEAFREILNKHVMRLNDEQFERVWFLSPINDYGNINYREFLSTYLDDVKVPAPPKTANPESNPRPFTSMSQRPASRMNMPRPATQMSRPYSRASSRCSTPMVNAEPAEQRLKDKVFRHWKDIQRQCRNLDTGNTGAISVSEFSDLLNQYNVDMDPQDFDSIITKYDIKENGRFCYRDFLRHFMISMRPKEGSALTARKKLQPLKVPSQIEEDHAEGNDLMTRVRQFVAGNWKDMRREFKAADKDGQGAVNEMEFRRIVRQFCANLSEEEFDTVVTTFDHTAQGLVSYNDFIKQFIC